MIVKLLIGIVGTGLVALALYAVIELFKDSVESDELEEMD